MLFIYLFISMLLTYYFSGKDFLSQLGSEKDFSSTFKNYQSSYKCTLKV